MDVIDQSDEQSKPLLDAAVAEVHQRMLADNVPSIEGECDNCGDASLRLVMCVHPKDGDVWACARCRDKYKLPNKR